MNTDVRVFLYGFKPFRTYTENVTEQIIHAFPDREGLKTFVFDVVFDREVFLEPLRMCSPSVVLGLGMTSKASELCIERRAINQMGHSSTVSQIIPEGEASLSCTLLLPETKDAKCTYDAGSYVCNFSMYTYLSQSVVPELKYAFLHVPVDYSIDEVVGYLTPVIDRALMF